MSSKSTPVEPRPRGIARDVGQIKRHGGASAAELAEFLKQLRGRRPQEVLGLVAQSGLLRATALATAGTAALLAVLTVVPYFLEKASPEEAPQAAVADGENAAAESSSAEAGSDAAPAATSTANATAGGPQEDEPDPELDAETLRRLGVEEAVPTDPGVNPLEDRFDDLLDDEE